MVDNGETSRNRSRYDTNTRIALLERDQETSWRRYDDIQRENREHHQEDDQRFTQLDLRLSVNVDTLRDLISNAMRQHTQEVNDLRRQLTTLLVAIITGSVGIIGAVLVGTLHH